MKIDENPIQDISSNNYDGTLDSAGNPDYSTDAPSGYAAGSYVFTNDKITFGDNDAFSPQSGANGKISIVVSAKFSSFSTTLNDRVWLVAKGASGNYEYQIHSLGDGSNAHFKGTIYDSFATESGAVVGTTNISTGVWYTVIYTFDKSAGQAKLYVNGVSEGTPGEFINGFNGTADLLLGKRGDDAAIALNGAVTEFAIFSDILSEAEVSDITEYGLTGTSAPASTRHVMVIDE